MQPFLLLPVAGMFAREISVFWLKKCHNGGIQVVNLSESGQEL